MNRMRNCFPSLMNCVVAVAVSALPATTSYAFDKYLDLPFGITADSSAHEQHIFSATDATIVRSNLINYLWDSPNLPTRLPTTANVFSGGAATVDWVSAAAN